VFEFPKDAVFFSSVIENLNTDADSKATMDVLSQMLSITKYLHSNGVMHRNFNPDCFLLNVKLCKL